MCQTKLPRGLFYVLEGDVHKMINEQELTDEQELVLWLIATSQMSTISEKNIKYESLHNTNNYKNF